MNEVYLHVIINNIGIKKISTFFVIPPIHITLQQFRWCCWSVFRSELLKVHQFIRVVIHILPASKLYPDEQEKFLSLNTRFCGMSYRHLIHWFKITVIHFSLISKHKANKYISSDKLLRFSVKISETIKHDSGYVYQDLNLLRSETKDWPTC